MPFQWRVVDNTGDITSVHFKNEIKRKRGTFRRGKDLTINHKGCSLNKNPNAFNSGTGMDIIKGMFKKIAFLSSENDPLENSKICNKEVT